MKPRSAWTVVAGITAALVAPSIAKADPAPVTQSAAGAPVISEGATGESSAVRRMRLGLTLVPAPFGLLRSGPSGAEYSVGSQFAFAVMPVFDLGVARHLFVGFAPSYTFDIKAKNGPSDGASELDLLLRIGADIPATDRVHLYGYISPGYAFMSGLPGDSSARGPVVGAHAGARVDLGPAFFLNAEGGYQMGFQSTSRNGADFQYHASFVQFGLGAGVRI